MVPVERHFPIKGFHSSPVKMGKEKKKKRKRKKSHQATHLPTGFVHLRCHKIRTWGFPEKIKKINNGPKLGPKKVDKKRNAVEKQTAEKKNSNPQ